MSEADRSDGGDGRSKVSDQDILKVFDAADEPVLTSSEVVDALAADISRQAVNARLSRMHDDGLVDRKKSGARAVVWWATVAPRLSEEAAARVEQSREEIERGDTVTLEDL